jgi:hypothetical protein
MTAVEWLKPQIELMLMDGYKSYPNELEEVFEIAIEIEKQQIIDGYTDGVTGDSGSINSEQYYNETFKK